MNPREMSLMQLMAYNLWQLAHTCGRLNQFYCCERAREVTAAEMFCTCGKLIFVRQEVLPFDPDVKAVFVNFNPGSGGHGRIVFETSMLDWEKVAYAISQERARCEGIALRGRRFFWKQSCVAQTRSQQHFAKGVESRRTLVYTPSALSQESLMPFLAIIDAIYGHNCFMEEAKPRLSTGQTFDQVGGGVRGMRILQRQELRQEMRQEMEHLLVREQKPLMAFTLYQYRRFEAGRLLRMNGQQLNRHVADALDNNPVLRAN